MTRFMTFYCLTLCAVLVTLLILSAACVRPGPSGADITATYGAQQYHLQLTAQAEVR